MILSIVEIVIERNVAAACSSVSSSTSLRARPAALFGVLLAALRALVAERLEEPDRVEEREALGVPGEAIAAADARAWS